MQLEGTCPQSRAILSPDDWTMANFFKSNLCSFCGVRVTLACVTLFTVICFLARKTTHDLRKDPLMCSLLFPAVAQILASLAVATRKSRPVSRKSLPCLLVILFLVPLAGLVPVTLLAHSNFYGDWNGCGCGGCSDGFTRLVLGWTYLQCLSDAFLSLASAGFCWGKFALSSHRDECRKGTNSVTTREDPEMSSKRCLLRVGQLHLVAIFFLIANLVCGRLFSPGCGLASSIAFSSLFAGNLFFSPFSALACHLALKTSTDDIDKRVHLSHSAAAANAASLLSATAALAFCAYVTHALSRMEVPGEAGAWIFVAALCLVALFEAVLSCAGITWARGLARQSLAERDFRS